MRFQDVMRQGKWIKQCLYQVKSVSSPQETANGLCQALEVVDNVGITETLNYFYSDEQLEIEASFVGEQWLDVRWIKDKEYYQCIPAEPPKQTTPFERAGQPDWYKINLGKCRHGILCAWLQSGTFFGQTSEEIENHLRTINELAKFSMTGEIYESLECKK